MNRRDTKNPGSNAAAAATAALPLENRGANDPLDSPLWRFIGTYLLLVVIGFIVFRHPSTMVGGNELSTDRAMFASVNAVTLTGFQQTISVDDYRWSGKVAALMLTVSATLLAWIAGGMAVMRIANTGCRDRGIIHGAILLELIALVAGVALVGRGRSVFESIFQAVSAVGHSGLVLGILPAATDWRSHLVLIPLALLGGLGIPVLLCALAAIRRRSGLHPYARLVLIMWAASYVVGLLALAALNYADGWRAALATASVQSINSRTAGLPFPIGDARPAQWVLIILMAIGGVSGAAAGGIKLTTLAKLWTGIRAVLRGAAPGRAFGIALVWVGLYAVIAFATLLGLLATNPDQPADRLVFLVISAVSNVGLSQYPVSIVGPGMFILAGAMFLGRVTPLAILWWTAHVTQGACEMPIG